jgi:hypothetical protein
MSSVFGFSTEASTGGGDFLPVVKYDSRAGRLFRIDRENDGTGWAKSEADITRSFKAVVDCANLETGYIEFLPAAAPVMSLVTIGNPLPPKPTPDARHGVRAMLKLSSECAGDKPRIREIAGNAKVFLQGFEALYLDYQAGKAANPDKLPIVELADTVPVKSGSGDKTSTNYKPVFKIVGWAARGDLVFVPKNAGGNGPAPGQTGHAGHAAQNSNVQGAPSSAPSTGSTLAAPPAAAPAPAPVPAPADEEDFG